MIIQAFATYLQSFEEDIPSVILLSGWIKGILEKEPSNNIERVIHHEINHSKNKIGMFMMTGKGESGKRLLESLYNFALSYEGQKFSRWIHDKNANDFQNL
ncbi:MAG: hypothetical protein WCF95_00690 [bacterium]